MTYSKEIFKYDLEEGYTLARAENQVFSKYYGIYYINNSFEKSYDNVCSITLVYDKHTKDLVGLCYISIWKEWPLISQIAVKPGYSGIGIGTNMIKKALTVLNEEYSAIRLYVDIGNKAEDLYYKLGFLKGSELINMKLVENLIGE